MLWKPGLPKDDYDGNIRILKNSANSAARYNPGVVFSIHNLLGFVPDNTQLDFSFVFHFT